MREALDEIIEFHVQKKSKKEEKSVQARVEEHFEEKCRKDDGKY